MAPRPSTRTTLRIVAAIGGVIVQLIVGLAFMAIGALLVYNALGKEPHNDRWLYVGLGSAVFGAMILPSIFGVVQRIYTLFFPNGLPFLGGRRATDPAAPSATLTAPCPRCGKLNVFCLCPDDNPKPVNDQ